MKTNKLENIFSVKNDGTHKVVTLCGVKFKFRSRTNVIRQEIRSLHYSRNCVVTVEGNLRSFMGQLAGLSSAQYIIDNMDHAEEFDDRFDMLKAALGKAQIEGCYLEFGVFAGKSINVIAAQKTDQTIYGFDSFEGLPEDWQFQVKAGHFAVDALPQVEPNVKLIKGWFNETLPGFVANLKEDVAFLHIDCDLYSSTKTIFECLGGKIKPGTIIVFDEYFNYPGWQQGEFKAFQEFVRERNLKYEYIGYTISMQVMVKIVPSS